MAQAIAGPALAHRAGSPLRRLIRLLDLTEHINVGDVEIDKPGQTRPGPPPDKNGYVRYWWYGELNWQDNESEKYQRDRIHELIRESAEV